MILSGRDGRGGTSVQENHKAGLVGPAFPLWNWFVRSCFDRRPRCFRYLFAVHSRRSSGHA